MDIEEFREYCLSFKGVTDRMPFGKAVSEYDRNLLVFYILGKKWFCLVNIDVFDFCTVKCAAGQAGELQGRYEGVRPAYHMNKKRWISVSLNRDVPDAAVRELVRQSYGIVASSLPEKDREALRAL